MLLAAEEFPRLQVRPQPAAPLTRLSSPRPQTLIARKFDSPGDVEEAVELVGRSNALQRAKDLAVTQVIQSALSCLPR